jgi:hypothetical protein
MTYLAGRCDGSAQPRREIDSVQVGRSPAVTMEGGAARWT